MPWSCEKMLLVTSCTFTVCVCVFVFVFALCVLVSESRVCVCIYVCARCPDNTHDPSSCLTEHPSHNQVTGQVCVCVCVSQQPVCVLCVTTHVCVLLCVCMCVYVCVCVYLQPQQRSKLFVAQHFMSEKQYERVKNRPLHKLYVEGAIRNAPLFAAWWRVFGVHSSDWTYDDDGELKVEMIGKDELYGVYTILLFDKPLTLDEVNVRCV
jgi:hypothetical protein